VSTFKVGDKVRTTQLVGDWWEGKSVHFPPGTVGRVAKRHPNSKVLPYDVQFPKRPVTTPVSASEIESASRFQRWLNRHFPKWFAEEKYGTDETVEAAEAVLENGQAVTVEGK